MSPFSVKKSTVTCNCFAVVDTGMDGGKPHPELQVVAADVVNRTVLSAALATQNVIEHNEWGKQWCSAGMARLIAQIAGRLLAANLVAVSGKYRGRTPNSSSTVLDRLTEEQREEITELLWAEFDSSRAALVNAGEMAP